jgi:hypothetical protein
MQKLESSNILDYDYDRRTRDLTLTFIGGRKYRYPMISGQRFSAFLRSESKGAYVNEKLRDLKCKKIT